LLEKSCFSIHALYISKPTAETATTISATNDIFGSSQENLITRTIKVCIQIVAQIVFSSQEFYANKSVLPVAPQEKEGNSGDKEAGSYLKQLPTVFGLFGLLEKLNGDPDCKANCEYCGTDGCYVCNDRHTQTPLCISY
jgi:hypothetical protein